MTEKKIEFDSSLWQVGRKSRKSTSMSSNRTRKKKVDAPEFDDAFSNQLSRLSNIIENNKEKQQPMWGNLKNGNLPTYRTYINNNPGVKTETSNYTTNTAVNAATNAATNAVLASASTALNETKTPPNNKTLGLNKNKNRAKIRIQGKKSRRRIKKYMRELEGESLTDIKNTLYNNCLIKCGTSTPVDVLKEMYKSSKLIGGVKNTNGDVLIHNFFEAPIDNDDAL